MVYRIRYRQSHVRGDGEAVVEANSPTEALVKFRHSEPLTSAKPQRGEAGHPRQAKTAACVVTSVCADMPDEAPQTEDTY